MSKGERERIEDFLRELERAAEKAHKEIEQRVGELRAYLVQRERKPPQLPHIPAHSVVEEVTKS